MLPTVLSYLLHTYRPHTMIAYGSYACGTQTEHSDFDVLVITDSGKSHHDGSVVDGVSLDAFIYTTQDYLSKEPAEFLQAYGGKILLDQHGFAQSLLDQLDRYVAERAVSPVSEMAHLLDWCKKMLSRAQAGDPEGMFRWHWLLYDSLEIYCNLRNQFYFGPKKALLSMRETDPKAYHAFEQALYHLDFQALTVWISLVLQT